MPTTIDGTSGVTFPAGGLGNPAGAVVGTTDSQTLTNKTLVTPLFNSAQFATVVGTAPIYACRAWVNFNGTGTVAIRASGNVSSITDNGVGDYTVNFTTAMPDANYAITYNRVIFNAAYPRTIGPSSDTTNSTTGSRFITGYTLSDGVATAEDPPAVYIAVFR